MASRQKLLQQPFAMGRPWLCVAMMMGRLRCSCPDNTESGAHIAVNQFKGAFGAAAVPGEVGFEVYFRR